MIRLNKCNRNPHHWYSAHALECPWCSIFQNEGREFFPPPYENPVSIPAGGSPERTGAPGNNANQEILLPHPSPPAPTASIPAWVWLGILGVLVVGVIISASLMLPPSANGTPSSTVPEPTMASAVVPTTRPTTIPKTISPDPTDPATGMKIYKNVPYGFSIDYPTGWKVSDGTGIVTFSPSKDLAMEIRSGYSYGTLQDYFLANAKRITTNSDNDVMNHDFKNNIGYRIDYIITKDDSISKTRVTEIYAQEEEGSDILVITISGSEGAYKQYSGDIDSIIRSFTFN